MNRQHPRDLFDIKYLLEQEGISEKIRQAFVIYLASNPRPIHELLMPNLLNVEHLYQKEFKFMTKETVGLTDLLHARDELIKKINASLTEQEKSFLISIKSGEPEYHLMPFQNLEKLPAIQWKLINIRQMEKKKHQMMLEKLKDVLEK